MTGALAYLPQRLNGRSTPVIPPISGTATPHGRVVCIERDTCRRRWPCAKGLCG